jgi:glycine dehydrogenase subunit 1
VKEVGLSLKYPNQPFFNEILVQLKKPVGDVLREGVKRGVAAGYDIGRDYPELKNCLLIAVTEKRTKAEMDRLVEILK